MGTKRVGWARIKSLINENQNALKHRRATCKTAITADTTLVAGDYGSLILLNGTAASNFELTLPTTPPLGAEFKFTLVEASNAAAQILLDSGTGALFEGYAVMYKADMEDGTTAFHSHRKLGWGDAAAKGGYLHVVCIDSTAGAVRWAIIDAKSSVAWINAHA